MAVKTPDLSNDRLISLEKENAVMKTELEDIYRNRKVTDLLSTLVWAFILYVCIDFMYSMAKQGVEVMAYNENMSPLGGALLLAAVGLCYLVLWAWIIYSTVMSIVYQFQNEIRAGMVKLIIFFRGGKKALKETPVDEEVEKMVPTVETGQKQLQ